MSPITESIDFLLGLGGHLQALTPSWPDSSSKEKHDPRHGSLEVHRL